MSAHVRISIAQQSLECDSNGEVRRYVVSTALKGAGERMGSFQTPRGLHVIRAKIGAGCPPGTAFVGRRPTGEIYTPALGLVAPGRDWILSRILWLSGREPGRNRGGEVDTLRRFIYIHGSPDNGEFGVPRSHGCVRMRNADVIELFDLVAVGDTVEIRED